MHQICYGFYRSIKKWSKLGQKTCFLAHFEGSFVYALLRPMSYAPRFCQMKDLIKIYICSNFHQKSICSREVKVKILQSNEFQLKWNGLKVYSFGPFWALFTGGNPKILLKTKISAKTTSFGISNNIDPRSKKNQRILGK